MRHRQNIPNSLEAAAAAEEEDTASFRRKLFIAFTTERLGARGTSAVARVRRVLV